MKDVIFSAAEYCLRNESCTDCPLHDEDGPCTTKFAEALLNIYNKSETKAESNKIDHPPYYQGSYECIDLMREIYGDEAVHHFCICNAYKYRFRAGAKQTEAAQDDIKKAEWYERYVMENIPQNYTAWADRRIQYGE